MNYLLVTYHWPVLTRPWVAGFKCPVTPSALFEPFADLPEKLLPGWRLHCIGRPF